MKCLDPGHSYQLDVLDSPILPVERLVFVKREGPGYPGNVGHYPGTTIQEVLRACLDRLKYLERQEHHAGNLRAIRDIESAITELEWRAAERHGRPAPSLPECCYGPQCPNCLHVGCDGSCQKKREVARTIHLLCRGEPMCGFNSGPPNRWPDGHLWVRIEEKDASNCPGCLDRYRSARAKGWEL